MDRSFFWLVAALSMFMDHLGVAFFQDTSLYAPLRSIGRIAFPVYAFLLVDGYYRSRNSQFYLLRVLFLACITQPFYSLFLGTVRLNICFLYFAALALIDLWETARSWKGFVLALPHLFLCLLSEYGLSGLLLIFSLRWIFLKFNLYLPGGKQLPKWLRYAFYPGHLFLLLICRTLITAAARFV